jgi:alpha/beta superfamily hydrolase
MREEKILIKNNALVIEALLHRASGERGAVICHPHSLMGGSMYNNVVEALQEAFASEGISTLRFNFRGVGSSTGSYSEGVGEKEDIWAAGNYLKTSGLREIFFAGYSFGAWVGAG